MKRLLLSTLLLIGANTLAQDLVVSAGLSVHSLQKLKDFQEYAINDAVVPLKSTQSFPPYFQFAFTARIKVIKDLKVGFNTYQVTTAARSTYEDYSGKIDVDQRLKSIGVAVHTSYLISKNEKGKLNAYMNLGVDLSKLNMRINIRVFDDIDNSNDDFHATSLMAEPGLDYQYELSKRVFLNINTGYHWSQEKMLRSTTTNMEYEKVGWTGFKLMGGIGINISGKKHS